MKYDLKDALYKCPLYEPGYATPCVGSFALLGVGGRRLKNKALSDSDANH